MIETKEKLIDGINYTVTQFAARRALRLKTRLLKLLAPSAFSAAGSFKGGNLLDVDLSSTVITQAIQALVDRMDADDCVNLILELLSSTRREGKEITEAHFDMVYAGNFGELFKALFFVLEVNFGSFFQGILTGKEA